MYRFNCHACCLLIPVLLAAGTLAAASAVPSSVSVSEDPASKIKIRWTAGGGIIDRFEIEIQPDGGTAVRYNAGPTLSTFTTPSLTKGQSYTVWVRAMSNGTLSAWSTASTLTLAPAVPSIVSVSEDPASKIYVRWTIVGVVKDKFEIAVKPDGGTAIRYNAGPTLSTFTTPSLTKGQSYTVWVRAMSNSKLSAWSTASTLTLAPAVPSIVSVSEDPASKIYIRWTTVGVVKDKIEIAVEPDGGTVVRHNTGPTLSTFTTPSPLTKGQSYTLRARAVSYSKPSAWTPAATITLAPAIPSSVAIKTITTTSVTVTLTLAKGIVTGIIVELTGESGGGISTETATLETPETRAITRDVTVTGFSPTLKPGYKYIARVKTKSGNTEGIAFSSASIAATVVLPDEDKSYVGLIVGVVAAVVIVIVGVIIIIFVVRRRRSRKRASQYHDGTVDTPKGEYGTVQFDNLRKDNEELRVRTLEIEKDRITMLSEKLGRGKYSEVWKGVLSDSNEQQPYIAIKRIKSKDPIALCRAEIDVRAKIGHHQNITSFLGYCLYQEGTLLLAMKFEPYGDLQSYLRENRPTSSNGGIFSEKNLLGFAIDVTRGMEHISKSDILHRDLRAHNILVGDGMVAKISGFDSSTINGVVYKDHKKQTPARWSSPEVLQKKEYTTKSDIWAFGILLWEIMTFGATPYAGMKEAEMKKFLHDGFRLSCPKSCEHPVYMVMFDCWRGTPGERPMFHVLTNRLESMRWDKQQYVNTGVYEDWNFNVEDDTA